MPLLPRAPCLKESQVAVLVKTLPLTKMGSNSFMRRTSAQAGRLSRGRRNSTVPNRGMLSARAGRAPKRPARKTAKQTMVHAIRCGRMTGDRRGDRAGGDTGGSAQEAWKTAGRLMFGDLGMSFCTAWGRPLSRYVEQNIDAGTPRYYFFCE